MTQSSRQTRDEESVTYLRAELAHAVDPSRRARLLFEIALAEEHNKEEPAAVRDYFAAHHADADFAEPLEALISLAEKDPSVEGSDELFAGLVRVASSPDEQVRAGVERARHQADVRGDLSDAKATAAAAAALEGASAGESACAWLALEILAGRTEDAATRRQALAWRAAQARDPTWRALLLIDRARLALKDGDVDTALSLLDEARLRPSEAAWTAFAVADDIANQVGPAPAFAAAQHRLAAHASRLEAMAALIRSGLLNPRTADEAGVPLSARHLGLAVDLSMRAAHAYRSVERPDAALAVLSSAASLVEATDPGEGLAREDKLLMQTILTRASLRLADKAGDAALATRLASRQLEIEIDPLAAASLEVRLAQQAASRDRSEAVERLESALRSDPACLPAHALLLDWLDEAPTQRAFAEELELVADHFEIDNAQHRTFLLSACVWALDERDARSAKAALGQGTLLGASHETIGGLARALASLLGDAPWYEEATKRLAASHAQWGAPTSLPLELVRLRAARGDAVGAAAAVRLLRSLPDAFWVSRVLQAFYPPCEDASEPAGLAALDELAEEETQAEWAQAVAMAAAMRAHAAGDVVATRQRLFRLSETNPADTVVAAFLADLARMAGDGRAAAAASTRAALSESDAQLAAQLHFETAFELWRAGAKGDALAAIDAARTAAPQGAQLVLGLASWSADAPSPTNRRRILDDAESAGWNGTAMGLDRFATEIALGDEDAAVRAATGLDVDETTPLGVAAALARLLVSRASREPSQRRSALDRIAAEGPEATLLAIGERLSAARESAEFDLNVHLAREWYEAGAGLPAAIEWMAAALSAGSPPDELRARAAMAECLSGEAREAMLASVALMRMRVMLDSPEPLVLGTSPAVRLANLELAAPGCDPRRRSAALEHVGDTLGVDAEIDALAMSGWSRLMASDLSGARAAFEAVVHARPNDICAWEGVRTCAEHAGDVPSFARAAARLGALCSDPHRGAAFWEQAALAWLDLGDEPNIEPALEASFARDPGRPVAFDRLFRRLRQRKDNASLLAVIGRRLQFTNDADEILKLYWEQARALRETGDQEAALRSLEQVTMLDPDHVGALALLGEINIRRQHFEQAASALGRLAGLGTAPVKSRVTAAVAAVDLYETKLGRFDQSLSVLLAVHAAGISTLPVRERLARAAARNASWTEATAILEELMHERSEPEGRAEAARLAMAIHRDRLGDPQKGAAAIVKLLEERPADPEGLDMLRRTHHAEPLRTRLLQAARTALLARLETAPSDGEAIAQLRAVALDQHDAELEFATSGALIAAGGGPPELRQAFVRMAESKPPTPRGTLAQSAVEALLAPGDGGPIGDLFVMLAPTLAEALGPNAQALGVGRRDRVDARSGLSLRDAIASWANAFGIEQFDLYIGGNDTLGVQGIPSDTPGLVVGPGIKVPLSPAVRARVARELFAIRQGTTIVRSRGDITIAAVVAAACRLAGVPAAPPPVADLMEVERQLGKALSWRARRRLPALCQPIAAGASNPLAWARGALASQDRIAVVACGDPSVVLAEPIAVTGSAANAPTAVPNRTDDLLRFLLSSVYLDARGALGLDEP
jgi:tetratricopeptide (TPR) repeat protein